jgi:PD-(D/E)XK endonuclease
MATPLERRKAKGDLAEVKVLADLVARGHKVALPYGEDWDYDLIVCRNRQLERVQVKYAESDGKCVQVKCFSASLTNGHVRRVKRYTAETVDWIAVYDRGTDRCFYVPSSEFADGRTYLHLRLAPAANNQAKGVRWARDFLSI